MARGASDGIGRVMPLGEPQSFNDLRMIWSAIKREANGGNAIREDVRVKIMKSLVRTLHEGKHKRTKILASAILLALADEDYERNIYRKPTQRSRRTRRTRK